ncbi:MAG: hypothetical protein K6V73_01890 [Firmicutes bacterium]|nr:hypothetical protein [Bacillota bacterium]
MDRVARALSVLFNPMVALTLWAAAVIALHPAWWGAAALVWLLLVALPGLALAAGLRLGVWSDADVSDPRQRRAFVPLAAACAVALAGRALLFPFPAVLRFAATAIAAWLCLTALASTVWKISMHVGSTVGILFLSGVALGWLVALALAWAPFAVAWARLRLRRHTPGQVVAGAAAALAAVGVALLVAAP